MIFHLSLLDVLLSDLFKNKVKCKSCLLKCLCFKEPGLVFSLHFQQQPMRRQLRDEAERAQFLFIADWLV